jgi:23S rRNA pseudouridine1911/1915/1917 synthase
MRLDVVLVQRVAGMSRAQARRLTSEGKVRINGRRAKKGDPLVPGDRVELEELPIPTDFTAAPDPDLPLAVVYEDARLVAVDKPPQVPSHPLRPDERGTVAGALAARYPEMRSVGYSPREPGIVHRLDTDTSGLLVAARDEATFDALRSDLKAGRWEKRYTAMVSGHLGAPRIVDFPLCRDPQDRRRVLACLLESEVRDPRRPSSCPQSPSGRIRWWRFAPEPPRGTRFGPISRPSVTLSSGTHCTRDPRWRASLGTFCMRAASSSSWAAIVSLSNRSSHPICAPRSTRWAAMLNVAS